MPFEIRHFVETNFYLRKDRSTHSISIISMVKTSHSKLVLTLPFSDIPKQICNPEILEDYLPVAKATIHGTCTLVAAARVRSHQIFISTNRSYTFIKQYGENTQLKITFPAGVTEEIQSLNVQV